MATAASLREAITGGLLPQIKEAAAHGRADHKLSDIKFLPVIPNPEKIMCVGINYKSHAAEHGTEVPKAPNIFLRFVNTLVPHEGEMIRPKVSTSFDFEGELALVIGKAGRHIKQADALILYRRLHLLLRRHRARLHQIFARSQQEFHRQRPARTVDGDRR